MDKPIFVDYESKICSAFLNTVANTVWDALGQAQTPVQARQFIGAVEEAPNDGGLYLRSNLAWVSATTSLQHNDLAGRTTADAHPISAITGLQSALDLGTSNDAAQDALIAGKASITYVDAENDAQDAATALLDAKNVKKTSNTGSALLPAGTDAQRDAAPAVGAIRFSSTNTGWEGWNGTNWVSIGAANASNVAFTPVGTIAANTVQAAIAELDSETQAALATKASIGGVVTQTGATGAANMPAGTQLQRPGSPLQGMLRFNQDLLSFEGFNGTAWASLGAANASSVTFTPVGSVQATNVQSAIAEVDAEKLSLTGGTLSGALTITQRVNCRGVLLQPDDPAGAQFNYSIWKLDVGGGINFRDINGTFCAVNASGGRFNNVAGESQLGVGPAAYIYANNSGTVIGMFNPNGPANVYLQTDGNFISNGNVTALSDKRLKKNLDVIDNALDKIQLLTGYTFDRTDCDMRQTGLIAQDVQAVLPEAVGTSDVDGMLTLNYGAMMGLVVEAIKELREEVAMLRGSK